MDWHARDRCLADVLAPLSTQDFFATYWEQEVLHIERNASPHFADLVSPSMIESTLSTQQLDLSDAQATGTDVTPDRYLDDNGHVVATQLLAAHHAGATLVLSQANRRMPTLAAFCRRMQAGFAMRCQSNVYLSPAGQQGFRAHYDSHDVIILQVQGRKTFQFYAGGPDLPANHHRFDPAIHKPGAAQKSLELSAGDTLYIPRGVMHDAIADTNAPSLHITLGLFPLTVVDLAQTLLQQAESDRRPLRQSIPGAHDMNRDTELTAILSTELSSLLSQERIDAALAHLRDDLAVGVQADCTGIIQPPGQLGQRVKAKLMHWQDIEAGRERTLLRIPGLTLTFSADKAQWVQRLAAGEVLDLSDPAVKAQSELLTLLARHQLIFTVD